MDKEFTFGIITYNHENFIIELLESIKYQIKNYGQDIIVNLVISDDYSKDNTITYVKEWLRNNEKLFSDINLLVSDSNQGVVKNFQKIMNKIDTEYFKVIAGDDVFANNNVFDAIKFLDGHNIVTFLPIELRDEKIHITRGNFYKHYINTISNNKSNMYYVEKQKLGSFFSTPSSFYTLSQYRKYYKNDYGLFLFEDDPLWHQLLMNDKKSYVLFKESYLVLYRRHTNAICETKTSPYAISFAREMKTYKRFLYGEEKKTIMKIKLALQIHRVYNKYFDILRYYHKLIYYFSGILCIMQKKSNLSYNKVICSLENT
ncbi:MAG: glycosyltransferase family 2 protein, partial [Eubacteriales bacterium]|nr:glycosyltransferase family 2 protein [Eubacteriales bacterium]